MMEDEFVWKNKKILVFFFLLLWFLKTAAENYAALSDQIQESQNILLNTGLSLTDFQRIEKGESVRDQPCPFLLWTEISNEGIMTDKSSQVHTASLVRAAGDLSLLLHGNQYLASTDTSGCLLSEALARNLFKSTEVIGLSVLISGNTYTVRGIIKEKEALAVILPKEEEDFLFHSLSLPADTVSSEFLLRHSIPGREQNFRLLGDIAQIFLMFLPFSLAVILIQLFLKRGLSHRMSTLFYHLVPAAVLTLGLVWLSTKFLHLPPDMIPDRWSNFSFWSLWWDTTQKDLLFLIQSAKSVRQADCIFHFIRCIFFCILSEISAFSFFRSLERL